MTTVNFIDFNGRLHAVRAVEGQSLMRAAVSNGLAGIDAECGGACACATCQVHVPTEWWPVLGEPGDVEREMLTFANQVRSDSRLSCQIAVTSEMDGLTVHIPESQS
ncbi:2Fe-2S iron-sulfur cluster binding domain-containing protein [Paraburkholderia sp. 1N]|uniref:2Fe-2S iron-sulfur cluster binding domain-containing protein n=2 Tax=Paraburkholderia solitsugae TaxID=2675748 RepID=A0ABX2C4D2_9BURK|nr:2Fe-2S iron-sulfur cluster binding domain-containing protein [Paraburkholderia solitsugae]